MVTEVKRTCKYCRKEYVKVYTCGTGHKYTVPTTFCSRLCQNKYQIENGIGCITPDVGKDALKAEALDFIKKSGSYCTGAEIYRGVGRSSKTFVKHGLSVVGLNAELGYDKPKSAFQSKVEGILKSRFDHVETEVQFEGLVGVTGHPLRVDFYIPSENTVYEADGTQHSDPNHPWREWNNGTVAEYDRIKNEYFADKDITLKRVPYKRNIKPTDVP